MGGARAESIFPITTKNGSNPRLATCRNFALRKHCSNVLPRHSTNRKPMRYRSLTSMCVCSTHSLNRTHNLSLSSHYQLAQLDWTQCTQAEILARLHTVCKGGNPDAVVCVLFVVSGKTGHIRFPSLLPSKAHSGLAPETTYQRDFALPRDTYTVI
jgi:hypothetical protein